MTVDQFRAKIRETTNTTTSDYSDASLIRDLNHELSIIQIHILRDRGVLEFDDSNYLDLPVATFPIVAGTASYKITVDGDGNNLLTKHKIAYQLGDKWIDVPRKTVAEGEQDALIQTGSGKPTCYYEIGKSIVFDKTPDFSGSGKVWFDRELDLVTTSDTTKEPGVPRVYHSLAAYRVSLNYAIDKGLPNENSILRRILKEEETLEQYEANRRSDEPTVMTTEVVRGL
jgi:hypothetical protein